MQILIGDSPGLFHMGHLKPWWPLGPGKAPLEQRQLRRTFCILCAWTQTALSHRVLKITLWTVMEFSCVTIEWGMRQYGCCRSGAPWNLNHPPFYIWEELGRLWVFFQTSAQLTCCRVSSPPCGLEEALWSACPATSVVHAAWWWAHVFYSHGQLQTSPSVPSSHLLMKGLKQW